MTVNPRIEELRRRVQKDPASIAFAQLAEEYRRARHFDEAVKVCREGLATHPSYLSARVTLGRALIELGQHDEAQAELEFVLRSAPENLAAIRGLAEIHQRRGELGEALKQYQTALGIAKHDPDLQESVHELARQVGPEPAPSLSEPPPLPVPPAGVAARLPESPPASPAPPAGEAAEPAAVPEPPPPLPDVPFAPPELTATSFAPLEPPAWDVPESAAAADPPAPAPAPVVSPELEAAAEEFSRALEALNSLSLELPDVGLPGDAPSDAAARSAEEPAPAAAQFELQRFEVDSAVAEEWPPAEAEATRVPEPRLPDAAAVGSTLPAGADAALVGELEAWLEAIVLDRNAAATKQS